MWQGVFPAVTTKFDEAGELDHAEMERCFGLMMEAGCDGIIVGGSLGEGPMLSPEEKIAVLRWLRDNLFSSPFNTLVTILIVGFLQTIADVGIGDAGDRHLDALFERNRLR